MTVSDMLTMRKAHRAAVSMALGLALAVGAVAPATAQQDIDAEQYFVELINRDRAAAGLRTVQSFTDVRDVAYAWAVHMADVSRMYHNPSYHEQYGHWLRAAENVGWTTLSNPSDPAQVRSAVERLHTAFMNSDGHRANIMHPEHDHIGVGVELRLDSCPAGVQIRNCMWVTENFRKWDGTQPAGGLQDPYAGATRDPSAGGSTTTVAISDKVFPGGFDGNAGTVERLGKSADSALQLSQARFEPDAAKHAVLARDDRFPDALAGSPLTADGPMLFTPSGGLTDAVRAELSRALPAGATVYLLGGTGALSTNVEAGVQALGLKPVRLAGADRIETAVRIADEVRKLYGDKHTVVLARAWGPASDPDGTAAWVDSVTGGAWAAKNQTPVLITTSDSLHPTVAAWIGNDKPRNTILLGGTAALSDAVLKAVPGGARVKGDDRAGTAAMVAKILWGVTNGTADRKFVVIDGFAGDGWRHGLAAAGLAADAAAPMLIAVGSGGAQPPKTTELVTSCNSTTVDLLLVDNITNDAAGTLESFDGKSC